MDGELPGQVVDKRSFGFSLVELLVVVVIIGVLAAIAVPIFMNQKAKAQDSAAKEELNSAGRYISLGVSMGTPAVAGEVPPSIPRVGTLVAPHTSVVLNPVDDTQYCLRTVSETGNVFYWVSPDGPTEVSSSSYCTKDIPSYGWEINLGAESTTSGAVTLDMTNNVTTLGGVGTYVDNTNGNAFVRTETDLSSTILGANWEYVEVTYTPVSTGKSVTDRIYRISSDNSNGMLIRLSNKSIRVDLPVSVGFVLKIRYTDKATDTTYNVPVV